MILGMAVAGDRVSSLDLARDHYVMELLTENRPVNGNHKSSD